MPGWGDDINLVHNLRTVVEFLLQQREADLLGNKAGVTGGCSSKHSLGSRQAERHLQVGSYHPA